ncbi:hypothetical protein [Pseudogemmobacter bohemicus]|uniref:hypothetical protein n=1 Tax=Pseudogemmobacter bohemicus TaxID=2250708 RepID=UPI000DD37D08|nr:hypothetical protein [Pseudogemmobacter bohemicus]
MPGIIGLAPNPVCGAVKYLDGRPGDLAEDEIEACIGHGGDEGVKDVGNRSLDSLVFGKRSIKRLLINLLTLPVVPKGEMAPV